MNTSIIPYLIASVIQFAGAIFLTFFRFRRKHLSGLRLGAITLLVAFSVMCIRLPLLTTEGENTGTAILHSILNAFHTISTDEDLPGVIDSGVRFITGSESDSPALAATGEFLPHFYAFFVTLQCIAAPLLCGFALIKSLSLVLAKSRLKFCMKPVFFFSRLTDESMLLARSILDSMADSARRGKKYKPALLCFIHGDQELSPEEESMWQDLRQLGAIRLRDSLSNRIFPRLAPCVNCILCDQNEQTNLHDLIHLLEESRELPRRYRPLRSRSMKYFIFAQSRQAEQVIDALSQEHISRERPGSNRIICMLNPKENLAVHILDAIPLYHYTATDEGGASRLNVLIAGSTPLADRFLRNAYACGQMHDCRLSITLAAPDAEEYRERLMTAAPLLRHSNLPVVAANGSLDFVTLPHPEAIADEALLCEADYILVAFDDDETNARCARRIRTIIERQKLTDPRRAAQKIAIVYAVEDIALHLMCRHIDAADATGPYVPCAMEPVGSRARQNHTDVLFGHELLRRAFFLDKAYANAPDPKLDEDGIHALQGEFIEFMNSAYQRRSSVATALHLTYRAHVRSSCPGGVVIADDLLAEAEHRRWTAYMIMSGFVPPTSEQLEAYFYQGSATHKNEALRLHPCITPCVVESTPELWNLDTPAIDPLDQLSRDLHRMAATRLAEIMKKHGLACPAPERITQRMQQSLIEQTGSIADPADQRKARALAKVLFRNYKRLDMNIISRTDSILRLAADPAILDALRLFWLEGD